MRRGWRSSVSTKLERGLMRTARQSLCGVVLLVASLTATSAQTPKNPPPGIGEVWAYAGTWKIDTEKFDTAHSKAGKESATLRNSCWRDAAYVACAQYVNGEQKILLVFTYNPKDKTYTSYQIQAHGGEAGSGKLIIDGNVWTFPWQQTENGATTYFRVVNTFTTPRQIEYKEEFSTDQQHWTLMAQGVETKMAGK
jgi:hypothetical protein